MIDYVEVFNDSYQRVLLPTKNNQDFFDAFYEFFFSASPLIGEKFKHTDMEHQKTMLRESFTYLMNFFVTKKSDDYMMKIAAIHSKAQRNIPLELYDIWLKSLIETVKKFDPKFDNDIELAWRIVLSPGITFMEFYYDVDTKKVS